MKVAVLIAIALALSGVGALAIQSAFANPGDPYNPYAPGLKQNNEVSAKTYAPGQLFQPGDPYRGSTFAPGILNQGIDVGHGPG
jgi:hypothetical protein